jgi:hypothetical protein
MKPDAVIGGLLAVGLALIYLLLIVINQVVL